jgi:hypothetical protein
MPERICGTIERDVEVYEFDDGWIGFHGEPIDLLDAGIVEHEQIPRGKCPSGRVAVTRYRDDWISHRQFDNSLLHLKRGELAQFPGCEELLAGRIAAARADDAFQRTMKALLPPR